MKELIEKIYEHPFISVLIIGAIGSEIADIVGTFNKGPHTKGRFINIEITGKEKKNKET